MRTIWQSLAWKEWHEHKWKLAALTAVLCSLSVAALFGDDARESLPALWLLCLLPGAIFLGLEAAAGESSRGTLAFLQALPVPLWRVAVAKLAAGLGAITIATTCIAVGLVHLAYLSGDHILEVPEVAVRWFIYTSLLVVTASASLYLWSAATGVRRPDEISAAAVSLTCILGCWLLLVAVHMIIVYSITAEVPLWLRAFGLAIAPGGFIALFTGPPMPSGLQVFGCIVAGFVHLGLVVWFAIRFGRGMKASVPFAQTEVIERVSYFARPPMQSQLTAIIWKQARESMPIVLVGLGGAAGIVTIAMAMSVLQDAAGFPTNYSEWFGHIVLIASIIFGIMVAVVAGMGAYLFDLGDRLGAFWRSRPISVDLWFWTKFFTGLVIVLVAFQVPMSLGHLIDRPIDSPGFRQAFALLWQITAYSTAAAGICLVRRPMYAVLLGLTTLYVASYAFVVVLGQLFSVDWDAGVPLSLTAIGLGLYSLVASLVAWLAVRYDWGWKAQHA